MSVQRNETNDQFNKAADAGRNATDEAARTARTVADEAGRVGEQTARAGADVFRRSSETARDSLQSGLNTATQTFQRINDQFTQALGFNGPQAEELRTHTQIRASCGMLWRAWSDGVVPLRMELVALDVEACHLLVSHLDRFRIAPRVQHAVHYQPACRCGRGNQIYDGRMADERAASPILGDVAEQAMLDLVPLRGAGRIVADRDR